MGVSQLLFSESFSPLQTALRVLLTVISAGGRPDRSLSVTLVRQSQSLAACPRFYLPPPLLLLLLLWSLCASLPLAQLALGALTAVSWALFIWRRWFDSGTSPAPSSPLIRGHEKPIEVTTSALARGD